MFRHDQLTALFRGRTILVAGYGREGKSSERLIRTLCPDADLDIADGNHQIATALRSKSYDLVLKSPGIPTSALRGLPIRTGALSSQADLFLRLFHDRVIGVSGTKGKSTTTSLIHHLLQQGGQKSILAGNIGIPLFDIIEQMNATTWVCAELSCHQLEGITRAPHISVLLNLFQEHLDHYDSYLDYQMAKMQIALRQSASDHYFYCTDNQALVGLTHRLPIASHLHPFGQEVPSDYAEVVAQNLTLPGSHNAANARVACEVAALAAADASTFAASLRSFKGLRHRLEAIGCHGGINWYDDSISTIPEAAVAAVAALPRVDTLILGGFDRGIDYTPVVQMLMQRSELNVVFVGKAGRRMLDLWRSTAQPHLQPDEARLLVCDDYPTLVGWCATHTPQGGTVLLSPAAASYDAFKNFEQRGDCFRQLVEQH